MNIQNFPNCLIPNPKNIRQKKTHEAHNQPGAACFDPSRRLPASIDILHFVHQPHIQR